MRDMTVIKEIFPEFEAEKIEAAKVAAKEAAREAKIESENNYILSIRNLMKNLNLSSDKAMEALGLSPEDKARYAPRL